MPAKGGHQGAERIRTAVCRFSDSTDRTNRGVRLRYLVAGILVGVLLASVGLGRAHRLSGHPSSLRGKLFLAKAQVRHDRLELRARHWLLLSRNPHRVWLARDIRNLRHLQSLLTPAAAPSWLVGAFMCIHRGEGSWTSNTGNDYFGGLQMDYSFMRAYGGSLLASKGTADHWTPAEQISVAIRAYMSGRGFYPWPNTARACGLL